MDKLETSGSINYQLAHYFISASTVEQCPPDTCLEVAFVGRSNAGKSSAINVLTSQNKLARTSKTPGRTQLLNYFELAPERYLVDLPGFGYAAVPLDVKRKWLEAAVRQLADLDGLQISGVSNLFETDPVGGPDQPVYLNAVVLARTRLAAFALLTELHAIEADHGRARETRWGARTLDLDLIQYGDPESGSELISEDPELMLPHPRAHERAFVLAPWWGLDAEAQLRVGEALVPVGELLERTDQDGIRPGPQWSPSW